MMRGASRTPRETVESAMKGLVLSRTAVMSVVFGVCGVSLPTHQGMSAAVHGRVRACFFPALMHRPHCALCTALHCTAR